MARFRWQRSKWVVQQTFHQGLKAFRAILRVAYLNQPHPPMLLSDAVSDARCVRRPGSRHHVNQNEIQQSPDYYDSQIFLRGERMTCLVH